MTMSANRTMVYVEVNREPTKLEAVGGEGEEGKSLSIDGLI